MAQTELLPVSTTIAPTEKNAANVPLIDQVKAPRTLEYKGIVYDRRSYRSSSPRKFDIDGRPSKEWDESLKYMNAGPTSLPKMFDLTDRLQPLQRHCAYFLATPESTTIYPLDTFHSVRAWGWNLVLSVIAVLFIHLGLAYFTQPKWAIIPNPRLAIHLERVNRCKHGSDSGSYNHKGNFRREVFNEFFDSYDQNHKGGLTFGELVNAWMGQRLVLDPFGWLASALEWLALYLLLWPADGIIMKEDVEGSFDGSIFWTAKALEDQRRIKRGLPPTVY